MPARTRPTRRPANSQLVVPGTADTFKYVARCVRRALLCGEDALTGRCYDHRTGRPRSS
jgi:hypothetical protein